MGKAGVVPGDVMIGRLSPYEAASAMLEAMCAAGVNPRNAGAVAADLMACELIRFPCEGDRGANGWAVLHLDHVPAGAFGNWKLGIKAKWRADTAMAAPSRSNMAAIAARVAQQHDLKAARHLKAESEARSLWQAAKLAVGHPYLVAKQLDPVAAAIGRQLRVRQLGADLLIPMRVIDGAVCNLQRIRPDGSKLFLPGGRLQGAFWCEGQPRGAPIIAVGEGFATMASVHLATGLPVVAAMAAANLEAVALAFHLAFPDARLILCADMDAGLRGNIGLEKANEAAAAVAGALVALPPRPADWPPNLGWDFADTFKAPRGADLIRRALGQEDASHG